MHFLINELSFVGQAANDYEADELMKNILNIIEEISVLQNGDPIQTHSIFSSQQLSHNLTIHEWISKTIKSQNYEQKKIAMILLRLLSKGPFVDVQDLLNDCKCHYDNQDVSLSSLAGAAKLQGILISLQNNPDFIHENIEVEFQEDINAIEIRRIKNLNEIKQAVKICPRYRFHSKHDSKYPWKEATPMDLTDEEAQKVLNGSVCNSNENSEKRYGYRKENDKFYVFHSDNTFDEKGYPTYHGFPISEDQVPDKIIDKIKSS
ncbi:hypothetical protein [Nodularia spumigena]|uniref:hypothetical protein n=1 Tax=Nodularia spumigena TaxID=70799 RepID=UPI00232CE796|nr:hypothetical protein [Nodularia spumigena]MDB9317985.1 hypothetical protein [Nodularia spumigena CS-590/01A]MDB9327593.1 hypothetical protein [Nodularia spumigena CS-590/02]MDB9335925.1 hypothetical protein [Nodularia spumigena CS-590/01]